MFSPFERLDADHTDIEGTGIGLTLSKRLVELMGGEIGFSSETGLGTTFFIEVAVAGAEATSQVPEGFEHNGSEIRGWTARVLYIEDNLANLTLVERILRHAPGVELLSALQGSLGLEMAREHAPDVVLLDVHLPDMSGPDVIAELLADPRTCEIPVVVLSADATDRQIKRLLDSGATAYLTKPLDVGQFEQVIGSLIAPGTKAGLPRI